MTNVRQHFTRARDGRREGDKLGAPPREINSVRQKYADVAKYRVFSVFARVRARAKNARFLEPH